MASNGEDALAILDRILAQQPKPDKNLFSRCTEKLAALRDAMIANQADRTGLDHVNAVISIVMAGHFPLGPVPWDELRLARDWLATVVGRPR